MTKDLPACPVETTLMLISDRWKVLIIRDLLENGGTNSYTIEKHGVHKMIFQSAWKENGKVAGLCEISMIIPAELPHHIRG